MLLNVKTKIVLNIRTHIYYHVNRHNYSALYFFDFDPQKIPAMSDLNLNLMSDNVINARTNKSLL